MPILGDRLDRPAYRILRSIHGGGVGEIKLVRHELFMELCVQKTYDTLGKEDSVAYREPQALRTIRHDHIVPIFDAQLDRDDKYAVTMVMPYYEGGSILAALMEDYRFTLLHAADLGLQILSALGHIHTKHRLLHRDGKPANVFLSADRRLGYLGDFGSAGAMDASGRAETVESTPLYRPPEAGPKTGFTVVPSDIYSAGMTLMEMVNGRFDYAALDPHIHELQRRLDEGLRPLPDRYFTEFAPHVPNDLRRVITRATAKKPHERWQTAGAMGRALKKVADDAVEWKHVEGSGLDGRWEGCWPPFAAEGKQHLYEITSRVGRYGRILEARHAGVGSARWSRFGVDDMKRLDPTDGSAVHHFFEAVNEKAKARRP